MASNYKSQQRPRHEYVVPLKSRLPRRHCPDEQQAQRADAGIRRHWSGYEEAHPGRRVRGRGLRQMG